MLENLLPRYSYRRLVVAGIYAFFRDANSVINRLVKENWKYFLSYSGKEFICNVCGERTKAFFDFPNLKLRNEHRIGHLRETIQCRCCGATMRHRMLAHTLLMAISKSHGSIVESIQAASQIKLAGLRVLDTDSFSPISNRLKHLPNFVRSSYLPDQPFGREIEPNRFNINLESIEFPDNSFDIVMTSDVAEHIRDVDAAHRAILRVLRNGGSYIFTVPFDIACSSHHILVDTSGGKDKFLVPPQYHGDPLTGGILAYRVFGQAIFGDFEALGIKAKFSLVNEKASLIIDGDVFCAQKSIQ